jgi:hypothetical protein
MVHPEAKVDPSHRSNLLLITVVLSVLAMAAAGGATAIGVTALSHATEASEHAETAASNATKALAGVEAEQRQLAGGVRASLESRKITVTQRCALTEHVGLHFPGDPWFSQSHSECEMQLAAIVGELAAAP